MTPGTGRPAAARPLATKPARVRKLRASASRSTRANVGLPVTSALSRHALLDVREERVLPEEGEVGGTDRAVALLGDDDLGDVLQVRVVLLVDAGAEDHHHDVGVLLE